MQKHPVKIEQYEQFVARKRIALAAAAFITLFAAVVYMGIGSLKISLPDIFRALAGEGEKKYQTAIMSIRLPRVLAAIFVGATLAASGAVMQCVLRNPLASASTLGVSQGAAFGAALGIIVFGGGVITNSNSTSTVSVDNPYIVTLCAFVFGSISSVVVILISRLKKNVGPGGLILAGTALSAMFAGGSTLLQYFADDTSLGAVVFWTFGNLGSASWKDLRFISVVFVTKHSSALPFADIKRLSIIVLQHINIKPVFHVLAQGVTKSCEFVIPLAQSLSPLSIRLMNILIKPYPVIIVAVLRHLTIVVKIVCKGQKNIMKFQIRLKLLWYCIIAKICTKNISANCTC